MPRRIDSDLLLVGSLPADSTEDALRAGGELFADMTFALPDGETGPRAPWTYYDYMHLLVPHPDVEVVSEPAGPPRHIEEGIVLTIRDGVDELSFDSWPRIDDAIESYGVFRALRTEGVIPSDVRFQVCLPFGTSALAVFKADWAHDFPIAQRAYHELLERELERLIAAIPAGRSRDPVGRMRRGARPGRRHVVDGRRRVGALRRAVRRLTRVIPEETLVGYHLCYGTYPPGPCTRRATWSCW